MPQRNQPKFMGDRTDKIYTTPPVAKTLVQAECERKPSQLKVHLKTTQVD